MLYKEEMPTEQESKGSRSGLQRKEMTVGQEQREAVTEGDNILDSDQATPR